MKKRIQKTILRLLGIPLAACSTFAGDDIAPDEVRVFKSTDEAELKLHLFNPEGHSPEDQRPAIIFFYGGGWSGGTPKQFYQQAEDFTSRGFLAISAEYRVIRRHGTTPFECVEDGKSAVRWVRGNAALLGVDPDRIVAAGGSAGGHVAACTGIIRGHEGEGEDLRISSRPNAMILYNPVVDTTEAGYGLGKVGEERKTEISPVHHIRRGIPPTLVIHGTADSTVPFENVERFDRLMREAGNRSELIAAEGAGHGFFNGSFFRPKKGDEHYRKSVEDSFKFLADIGFME
jgi:acetyl esterase